MEDKDQPSFIVSNAGLTLGALKGNMPLAGSGLGPMALRKGERILVAARLFLSQPR